MSTIIPKPFSDRPLWGADKPFTRIEDAEIVEHFKDEYDGIMRLSGVTNPTISFFPATDLQNNPRPAVVICPGGGYNSLAWNHEGLDIAMWLNCIGFSAFLLKYRCPGVPDSALADAARAIRTIRANTEAWSVIPDKVGIIGFSAGAHLSARISSLPEGKEPYQEVDDIDKFSCTPNFQILVYPAFIYRDGFTLDPDFEVTDKTPPAFIIQAEEDCYLKSSLAYYIALSEKKIPAEMHLFTAGKDGYLKEHGYGIVRSGNPTEAWTELAAKWLIREFK